jgi:hypothetical protein
LSGRSLFCSAPFELCGRTFGQMATPALPLILLTITVLIAISLSFSRSFLSVAGGGFPSTVASRREGSEPIIYRQKTWSS